MSWIVVRNWPKFQHYTDRDPPWIKLYTELNSSGDWLDLSTAARGMLTTIWVEYARSRGRLRVEKVMQLCGKSARSKHLQALSDAGWIEIVASRPLALTRSREKKSPSETEKTRGGRPPNRPVTGKVTGWRLVRGSHGVTHIPDPAGVDRPPF